MTNSLLLNFFIINLLRFRGYIFKSTKMLCTIRSYFCNGKLCKNIVTKILPQPITNFYQRLFFIKLSISI